MFKLNTLLALAILSFSPALILAQQNPSPVVTGLNQIIQPISTLRADSSFEDINFLKVTLQDKEIVALGEVSHGTKEAFNYKDRLARFLISNLGYKAIAFESDFFAIENIDAYVNGKVDTLSYLRGTALHGTNRSMIKWIRKYNEERSEADKVHLYGFELRNYLNVFNRMLQEIPDLDPADRKLMENHVKQPLRPTISKEERRGIEEMVARLKKRNLPDLQQHYVNMIGQTLKHNGGGGARDTAIADNVSWIKDRVINGKLIVWAHNGHVAKNAVLKHTSMGSHLYQKYGQKYYVIATDFNSGTASVNVLASFSKRPTGFKPYYYPPVKSQKSYEYFFHQCKYTNFILDIKAAAQNAELNKFLEEPLLMRTIGALSLPSDMKVSISENYDMIVYVDKTTSS